MPYPNALATAVFLILAFVAAGFLQTFWFKSDFSNRFRQPIDGGKTFRGKRIFGTNKTWRGFVAMVPGLGIIFILVRLLTMSLPLFQQGMWELTLVGYGALGCWVGIGFMAGELPNSFLKRQFGVQPGEPPAQAWARPISFVIDRFDSIAGGLLFLTLVVPTPLLTWCCILAIGPVIHWAFNLLLFQLGVKARPA